MIIHLDYIENILKNINNFETWSSDMDETGQYKLSGSIEFEIKDTDDRLWGGRVAKIGEEYQLVEFFSKIFYSDYNPSEWSGLSAWSDEDLEDLPDYDV